MIGDCVLGNAEPGLHPSIMLQMNEAQKFQSQTVYSPAATIAYSVVMYPNLNQLKAYWTSKNIAWALSNPDKPAIKHLEKNLVKS